MRPVFGLVFGAVMLAAAADLTFQLSPPSVTAMYLAMFGALALGLWWEGRHD
jgi:hypothetical protein